MACARRAGDLELGPRRCPRSKTPGGRDVILNSQVEDAFESAFGLDVRFGYLDAAVRAPMVSNPQVIVNGSSESMLRTLRRELATCDEFVFSVAFVSAGALSLLKQELVEMSKPGTIVTSDYLGFNRPEAFAELLALQRWGVESRFHGARAYHPKGYIFRHGDHTTAILGSSNLTKPALTSNHEWNLRVTAAHGSDLARQLDDLIEQQRVGSAPVTEAWADAYRAAYDARVATVLAGSVRGLVPRLPGDDWEALVSSVEHANERAQGTVEPNQMQVEALGAIADLRAAGARRAVVISATGTGKTVLAALDVRSAKPARVLFVAHREQILDRAMEEFSWVLGVPSSELGKLTGNRRDRDGKFTFATIQTLSRPEILSSLSPAAFDYILVDEVHRAGAASYRDVIEHFKPGFLLGMTATPERTDGFNVFELFDFNVPYEIRLNRALEDEMLCPFHYYGVSDATFEDGTVASAETGLDRLVSRVRVDHIVQALETYGQAGALARGLVFCSRTDEAHQLAAAIDGRVIHGRRVAACSLTGADSIEARETAVRRLEAGELQYIFTVDVFNEGVDIPSVNQVVMLRQTKSSIVFVQQLGRGLRKHASKDYVVVIDFIGNYANNYLIPVALFSDESLNKESLRQKLIAAEEAGVIAGLSSVRFDRISQQRVLDSITQNRLDSMANLKGAFDLLRNRLGRAPLLTDFVKFDSVDPGVLATKAGNYPQLVARFTGQPPGITAAQSRVLTLMSNEVLVAKRRHEELVVRELLDGEPRTLDELVAAVRLEVPTATAREVVSAVAALDLSFGTEQERTKYGAPLVELGPRGVSLAAAVRDDLATAGPFREGFMDVLDTSASVIAAKYDAARPFTPGRQYSRKDATRLLAWGNNSSSTIYGYHVHKETLTCPIFVTMHKASDVSASTAYDDGLIDTHSMRWFTRSRRSLASAEVAAIVNNDVTIHVFAKKSDAEGSDFYYLGRAIAENAIETTMPDAQGEPLGVVRMTLRFETPIESAVYDYFHPMVTT